MSSSITWTVCWATLALTSSAAPTAPPVFSEFQAAIEHFHEVLTDVALHIELGAKLHGITPEILLQGPFSDAMTHAGQLALLRRLCGSPVPPENFIYADITPENLSPNPAAPTRTGPRNLSRESISCSPECRAVDLSRSRLQLAKQNPHV